MRIDELKKRQKFLSRYGQNLTKQYENYKEGSLVLAIFFFIGSVLCFLFGTGENKYSFIVIGISFIFTGVTFIFITGLFKLMGQIKEMCTIILLQIEKSEDKEETP